MAEVWQKSATAHLSQGIAMGWSQAQLILNRRKLQLVQQDCILVNQDGRTSRYPISRDSVTPRPKMNQPSQFRRLVFFSNQGDLWGKSNQIDTYNISNWVAQKK